MDNDIKKFIPPHQLGTAVLFLVFNRFDTTKKVFEQIRQAKPPRLYIAGDGARKGIPGETEKVEKVRSFILTEIDWKCDVKTLFRTENIGCKLAVSSAIDWFFDQEEQGIILEDDCLPSQSFFWFCEELLEKYKDDERIMHIAGMTYVEKSNNPNKYSYHFARVGGIWGWASWRRAWKLYQSEMQSYPQAKKEGIFDDLFVGETKIKNIYIEWFDQAYGNNHTWDYQWTYTKIINNSINIMPAKNLVRNIGCGAEGATHTIDKNDTYIKMKLYELTFPLVHPNFIVIDREFNYRNIQYITKKTFFNKLIKYIKLFLPNWIISLLRKVKKFLYEKI